MSLVHAQPQVRVADRAVLGIVRQVRIARRADLIRQSILDLLVIHTNQADVDRVGEEEVRIAPRTIAVFCTHPKRAQRTGYVHLRPFLSWYL